MEHGIVNCVTFSCHPFRQQKSYIVPDNFHSSLQHERVTILVALDLQLMGEPFPKLAHSQISFMCQQFPSFVFLAQFIDKTPLFQPPELCILKQGDKALISSQLLFQKAFSRTLK